MDQKGPKQKSFKNNLRKRKTKKTITSWITHVTYYANSPEAPTFLPLTRTRTCVYQGVSNDTFSKHFPYVLTE